MWARCAGAASGERAVRRSHADVGEILKTNSPDARHGCTRSLYARFSPQSIPQHTRFSTGQKHNGRGWRVKREDLDAYVKKL